MFEQLKRAFSDAARNLSSHKEISEKVLDNQLSELELSLLESDVAPEVVDDLVGSLRTELLGLELEKGQNAEDVIRLKLRMRIADMFNKSGNMNLVQQITSKKEAGKGPFVILLLGINGTGKTTTIAKIARLFKKNGISTVLAAADTHRAGAIEQLSQHGENLSIKVISQRYGADPSAVGRDAVDYATKHRVDTVLIDTAGRMQTAKNLMDEINKIVRVVKPDIKLFIGDSLTGNDTINQAREFFEYTKFDGAILTKTDADAKGGSAISIVHATSKPIVLLGMGQGYDDITPFSSEKFLDSVFANSPLISEKALPSNSIIQQDTNRNEKVETDIELAYREVTLRTVSNDDTSERLKQKIDGTPAELPPDSDDSSSSSSNYDSLTKVSSEELTTQQQQTDQQERHLEQSYHSEQPQDQVHPQQLEQKQQQGYQEQQPPTISSTSDKKLGSTSEKKESGGFLRGLFGKKNKYKTQDPEMDSTTDKSTIKSFNETNLASAVESEGQSKTKDLVKNNEKKTKSQRKDGEEETVYLTDEDIEDFLK
ncbi:MAG: signal recognition particle-docking protein FtsY [Nitrososphaeraceae archaeon]